MPEFDESDEEEVEEKPVKKATKAKRNTLWNVGSQATFVKIVRTKSQGDH